MMMMGPNDVSFVALLFFVNWTVQRTHGAHLHVVINENDISLSIVAYVALGRVNHRSSSFIFSAARTA